jgi:CRISPR system Cascade subunit CasA
MNLATEPWIPVVWENGEPGSASLLEAFRRGHEIRDLAVRPHERIALMRLLICIAQAALDGPADDDDWSSCLPRIVPAAVEYLGHWRHAFELFGDGQRFLQLPNLSARKSRDGAGDDEEVNSASKLDLALATGNNATLFDNAGGSERAFTAAALALNLLTFQCFSPGGRIGVLLWGGEETPGRGSSDHAPCIAANMVHALLRGNDLLSSLHKNLLTKHQAEQLYGPRSWGNPAWEQMPQGPADAQPIQNASRTYLGRLVPLMRAVWLGDDGRSMILGNGIQLGAYHKTGWREPTATVVVRARKGTEERVPLSASVDKGLWRELHALTVKTIGDRPGGPAALQHVSTEAFDLWVGGLVAGKAKLVDTVESVFHVPAQMLHDTGQRVYEEGVKYSERAQLRLRRAISSYRVVMESSEQDLAAIGRTLATLKRSERERLRQIAAQAERQFWTDIEMALPYLLGIAENPEKLGSPPDWQKTPWGKAVLSAMRASFERACPHETPRQMRAFILGLNALFAQAAGEPAAQVEEEVEA